MNHSKNKSMGYALQYNTRMGMALLQERIKQYGVAVGQFQILVHLWEKQGITQKSLCELIRVEQPTLANTLKRMERDELINRVPDTNDKRQWRIYLTEKAVELENVLQEESRIVNELITGGLTDTEQQEFRRLLDIITTTLEEEVIKGLPSNNRK